MDHLTDDQMTHMYVMFDSDAELSEMRRDCLLTTWALAGVASDGGEAVELTDCSFRRGDTTVHWGPLPTEGLRLDSVQVVGTCPTTWARGRALADFHQASFEWKPRRRPDAATSLPEEWVTDGVGSPTDGDGDGSSSTARG